jgi:hypothetical protein
MEQLQEFAKFYVADLVFCQLVHGCVLGISMKFCFPMRRREGGKGIRYAWIALGRHWSIVS